MFLNLLLLILTFCVVATGLWCGLYTMVMAQLCYDTPRFYDNKGNELKEHECDERQHKHYTKRFLQVAAGCGLLTGFMMSPLEVLAHFYNKGTVPCALYGWLNEIITSAMVAAGAGVLLLSMLQHLQRLDSPFWDWVLKYVPWGIGVLAIGAHIVVGGSQKLYMGEFNLQVTNSTSCPRAAGIEDMVKMPHWLWISTMINAIGLLLFAIALMGIEIFLKKASRYFANDDEAKMKVPTSEAANPLPGDCSSQVSPTVESRNRTSEECAPVQRNSQAKHTSVVSASMASSKSDLSEVRGTHGYLQHGSKLYPESQTKRASQITLPGAIADRPDITRTISVSSKGRARRFSDEPQRLTVLTPNTSVIFTCVSSTTLGGNVLKCSSPLPPLDVPRELPPLTAGNTEKKDRTADKLARSPLIARRFPKDNGLRLETTRELPTITGGRGERMPVKIDVTKELPLIFHDKIQNWNTQPEEHLQQHSMTIPNKRTSMGIDPILSPSPISFCHSPISGSASPSSGNFLSPFQGASPNSRKKLTWSAARQLIVETDDDDNVSVTLEPLRVVSRCSVSEDWTTPTEVMSGGNGALDIADVRALTPVPPSSASPSTASPEQQSIAPRSPNLEAAVTSALPETASPEQPHSMPQNEGPPVLQKPSSAEQSSLEQHPIGGITNPRSRLLALLVHLGLVILAGLRLVWEAPIMLCQSECWLMTLILPLQRLCLALLPVMYLDIGPKLGDTKDVK